MKEFYSFQKGFFKNNIEIIDVGCGGGRYSLHCLLYNFQNLLRVDFLMMDLFIAKKNVFNIKIYFFSNKMF